jgi:pimeloyl-ACP methyl ester carboxylesterase
VTLFALLHGGMHHGSSWDLVVHELTSRGHQVVAPDLPVDDDAAGATEWARVAIDAIDQAGDDDAIVVGHSIAGLSVPVVAALHPVRRMVFVGGLLPVPGHRFVDHLADNPDAISFPAGENSGSGPFGLTWESVRAGFYHDCPESLARQAFDELRGQSFTVLTERCPLECWPDVPSTYVLMRHDRAVGRSWARRNAVDRVGATVIEMDGGHSPFFARPTELGDVLAGVAEAGV